MNQDIIDYLEGHWEWEDSALRHQHPFFEQKGDKGVLSYFPKSIILLISNDGWYGYEVQIRDLQHLVSLEALL